MGRNKIGSRRSFLKSTASAASVGALGLLGATGGATAAEMTTVEVRGTGSDNKQYVMAVNDEFGYSSTDGPTMTRSYTEYDDDLFNGNYAEAVGYVDDGFDRYQFPKGEARTFDFLADGYGTVKFDFSNVSDKLWDDVFQIEVVGEEIPNRLSYSFEVVNVGRELGEGTVSCGWDTNCDLEDGDNEEPYEDIISGYSAVGELNPGDDSDVYNIDGQEFKYLSISPNGGRVNVSIDTSP